MSGKRKKAPQKRTKSAANRRADGTFGPGNKANPGGRPKTISAIREAAQAAGDECIAKLLDLMRHSEDERVQIAAAREILDRGYGRPAQSVTGADGGPTQVVITYVDDWQP